MSLPYPYNKPTLKVVVKNQPKEYHLVVGDKITIEVALNKDAESGYVNINIDPGEVGLILDGDAPSGKRLIFDIEYKFVDV